MKVFCPSCRQIFTTPKDAPADGIHQCPGCQRWVQTESQPGTTALSTTTLQRQAGGPSVPEAVPLRGTRLICPSCLLAFSVEDHVAGRQVRCPECGEPVRADPADAPAVQATLPVPPLSLPWWRRKTVFAAVMALACAFPVGFLAVKAVGRRPAATTGREGAADIIQDSDLDMVLDMLVRSWRVNYAPTANQVKAEEGRKAFMADVESIAGKEYVFSLLVAGVDGRWVTTRKVARLQAGGDLLPPTVTFDFRMTDRTLDWPDREPLSGRIEIKRAFNLVPAALVPPDALPRLEADDRLRVHGRVTAARYEGEVVLCMTIDKVTR